MANALIPAGPLSVFRERESLHGATRALHAQRVDGTQPVMVCAGDVLLVGVLRR